MSTSSSCASARWRSSFARTPSWSLDFGLALVGDGVRANMEAHVVMPHQRRSPSPRGSPVRDPARRRYTTTTTTPFDMVTLNPLDRFHLVIDVIDRVDGLASGAALLRQQLDGRWLPAGTPASSASTTPRSPTGRGIRITEPTAHNMNERPRLSTLALPCVLDRREDFEQLPDVRSSEG